MWSAISASISAATGRRFAVERQQPLGGGCINAAYRIESDDRRYFVKTNSAANLFMFEAEAAGLDEIARSNSVRVPRPVCHGIAGGASFLVLEYLEFGGRNASGPAALGRRLARMHRATADHYGWYLDNTIGSTPQPNTPSAAWVEFWREQRLAWQLQLAARNGHTGSLQRDGELLLDRLGKILAGHTPTPSLLHGDLWSGNYALTRGGEPVVFDPAVYYGDRETDIAMTELFGGFPAPFYAAYNEEYPLDDGYDRRRILYNLYHVLNHLNLFGGGYLAQAERMTATLLDD